MKNAEYWAERMRLLEEALHDKALGYYANLEKQFNTAIKDIEKDIRAWYQRFADNNGGISFAQSQKLLTADELKEFKWDVYEYIDKCKENAVNGAWVKELENASARVHISRLESLKLQLRQQAETLSQQSIKATTDATTELYSESYYHTAFEIQKGIGVGWTMQGTNKSLIEKIISRPWTADNRTFTARCWTDKMQLVETISQELTRMVATGDAPDRAISAIAKRFNVSKSNAGRVVMTESAHFAEAATKDCFDELGVERYQIIAGLDTQTCNVCADMDKKVFKMSEYSRGATAPRFHPRCRCTIAPYEDDMEGLGTRFARDAKRVKGIKCRATPHTSNGKKCKMPNMAPVPLIKNAKSVIIIRQTKSNSKGTDRCLAKMHHVLLLIFKRLNMITRMHTTIFPVIIDIKAITRTATSSFTMPIKPLKLYGKQT